MPALIDGPQENLYCKVNDSALCILNRWTVMIRRIALNERCRLLASIFATSIKIFVINWSVLWVSSLSWGSAMSVCR